MMTETGARRPSSPHPAERGGRDDGTESDTTGPDAGAPPSWRLEAIEALDLDPDERQAAASPSLAFPAMLSFITPWLERARPGRLVDIGAGLGGITDAVRERTGLRAFAFDHSVDACAGARRLFPAITAVAAAAARLPLRAASMGAALLSGVLSRTSDLEGLLAEAHRVLSEHGQLIIVDVVSSDEFDLRVGSDVYRSIETIESALPEGLSVVDRAIGEPWSGEWDLLAAPVARRIAQDRRGELGFDRWLEHQRHLERVISSGEVLVAGIVAAA